LQRCNAQKRLDPNIDKRIRKDISSAIGTGFFPTSLEKLKDEEMVLIK
jgi:hypothetical protein